MGRQTGQQIEALAFIVADTTCTSLSEGFATRELFESILIFW